VNIDAVELFAITGQFRKEHPASIPYLEQAFHARSREQRYYEFKAAARDCPKQRPIVPIGVVNIAGLVEGAQREEI
jgi:hypothetical protein